MTSAARPVARLTSPAEVVAVVPALCGFVPQESLVVVALRGARRRLGLTMRFDLDWARSDAVGAAEEVADRLELDGAGQVVLVVFSELPGELCWSGLVEQVRDACAARGIGTNEALLVRDGRWYSYVCTDDACCPSAGTSLVVEPTPALRLVEAERVLGGRVVLGSRAELVASLAPPVLLAAAAARQALDTAVDVWLERHERLGRHALRRHGLAAARALVDGALTGSPVSLVDAAELTVAVQDVLVRDEIATWCLDDRDALLSVLVQTARLVVAPDDAPVLALVAWVAYADGDGGLANVALDRCLTSDPDYALGHLLREMLLRQVPPAEVRGLLKTTARRLRKQ